MDYEKKYKEALERAKKWYNETEPDSYTCIVEGIFPELKESEDERIRKAILELVRQSSEVLDTQNQNNMVAWLEKHGKKKKVSIWKHWTGGIAGNSEGEQIYLLKIGNIYSISSCLGFECDYIELSELDKLMREEKQGNKACDEFKENTEKQGEHETTDNKEKLGVLNFIRKETCCGLAEANNALLKLIKVLKEHPFPIMDKPRKLKIEWEE